MAEQRQFKLKSEYITLGQILKAAGVVSSGTEAKAMVSEGELVVNGEPEDRRGRKLRPGDTVALPDGGVITIE